jgi:hypothetical protein
VYTMILTGSRNFKSYSGLVETILVSEWNRHDYDIFFKVGDCPTGLDKIVRDWCNTILGDEKWQVFYADWKTYGKAAGPIRNHAMVDSGADLVIAFPDDGSRGTKDCAEYADKQHIPVWFPELSPWAQWAASINQWRS